jgi:hypothetical protein
MAKGTVVTFENYTARSLRLRFCPPQGSGFASLTCFTELVVCGDFSVNIARDIFLVRRDFSVSHGPLVVYNNMKYPYGDGDWMSLDTGKGFSEEVRSQAEEYLKVGLPSAIQISWITLTTSFLTDRFGDSFEGVPADEYYVYVDAVRAFLIQFAEEILRDRQVDAGEFLHLMESFIASSVLKAVAAIPIGGRDKVVPIIGKMFCEFIDNQPKAAPAIKDTHVGMSNHAIVVVESYSSIQTFLSVKEIFHSGAATPCIVVNVVGMSQHTRVDCMTQALKVQKELPDGASVYIDFSGEEMRTVTDRAAFFAAMENICSRISPAVVEVTADASDVRHPLTAFLDDGSGAVAGGIDESKASPGDADVQPSDVCALSEKSGRRILDDDAPPMESKVCDVDAASIVSSSSTSSKRLKKNKRKKPNPSIEFFKRQFHLNKEGNVIEVTNMSDAVRYVPLDVAPATRLLSGKDSTKSVIVGRTFSFQYESHRYSLFFSSSGKTLKTTVRNDSIGAQPPITSPEHIGNWTEHHIVYASGTFSNAAGACDTIHFLVRCFHNYWMTDAPDSWLATYSHEETPLTI